jgi:hypothetical protein
VRPALAASSVRAHPARRLRKPLALLAVFIALAIGVDAIGDATQVRPEALVLGTTTELVLDVRTRHDDIPTASVMPALLEQCRGRLHRPQYAISFQPLGGDQYLVRSTPALGRHSTQKLTGCFRDLVADFVLVRVESVRHLPAPAVG